MVDCGLSFACVETMKKYKVAPLWQAQVDATRKGMMQVFRTIRNNEPVEEEELDKLQNFCLFALALMQAEGPKKWELAKLNAELMSLMKEKNA